MHTSVDVMLTKQPSAGKKQSLVPSGSNYSRLYLLTEVVMRRNHTKPEVVMTEERNGRDLLIQLITFEKWELKLCLLLLECHSGCVFLLGEMWD